MSEKPGMVDGQMSLFRPLMVHAGLVKSLWRHWFLFLCVFGGVVGIALAAAILLPAKYISSASVIVAESDPATRISDVWAQKQGDPADLESQIMILRSSRMVSLALKQPGALEALQAECKKAGQDCSQLTATSPEAIELASDHFSMAAVGRSRVLSVSYSSALPEVTVAMANALVTAYLEDQREAQSNSREVAAKWLWQEITDLDNEIREKVSKIEAFRRENGLVRGATADISSENLTGISQQLVQAEQAKAQAEARLAALRDLRNGGDVSSSALALDNRTVADLKQQIASVGNQLAASSAVLGPRHPQRRMLESSMGLLKQQLASEINRVALSAQKDFDTASALVQALQKRMDGAKDNAATAVTDESSIEGMVRDVDAKRQLYTQLYQKASELESERRSLNGSVRLVSLAEMPTKPFFPKKTPMVAAGVAVGLFLAVASCVLWDRFRPVSQEKEPARLFASRGVRRKKKAVQAENDHVTETGLAIIGSLPGPSQLGVGDDGSSSLSELIDDHFQTVGFQHSIQELAASVMRASAGRPVLVLPFETGGRSAAFLTLALGETLANSGFNVLAIECAPAIREFAALYNLSSRQTRLNDVIRGRADPADAAARTPVAGLHVIAGGEAEISHIAAGHLEGLEDLFDWASPYDLVLISGPSLSASEAEQTLSELARLDITTLVCVSRDQQMQTSLVEAEEQLATLHMESLGAVVMPPLARTVRRADPFARQRRKIA